MSATFDTSRLTAKFAALRAALPAAVEARLPLAALGLIEDSGYAEADGDETGAPEPITLLTEIVTSGSTSRIGILQLYDWVIDPGAAHCVDPDGLDCPTIAANGPYTDTFAVRPGDGTTPCKDKCHCTWEPRTPVLDGAAALAELGLGVRSDLAAVWGSA